ncbi:MULTISPECIES: SA1320 family protein [unclassified Granulicatella]|uniref:SA1320 family protein n=1 Tax=unclassified Granulicatella TaxID=2630493 RepID=UPI0018841ACB|nr:MULTISPECIES: hypothetical protein [unclassified Granulicatella]MBF0779765.1 hypothetical protein [Granulicatella sp. 19428wC4_WM01]
MITDEMYSKISEKVYWTEKKRLDVPYHPQKNMIYKYDDDKDTLGQFHVIDVEDNLSNGMQAMAVAPVIDGQVDTSQIVIAYAGTNIWDGGNDFDTDLQSIGLGNNLVMLQGSINKPDTLKIVDTQPKTALAFAEEIRKKYRNSKITTTGHSLGESLAMYVALKNGWNNVGFNGPDISNMISKEEIEYMKANPKQFRNFRNWYDWLGGIVGDTTNSALHLHYGWGLYTHSLSDWKTNDAGQIVYANGEVVDPTLSDRIDINADGKMDILLNDIDVKPRNLLSQNDYITSSKDIIVNPDLLNTLADNLSARIQEDLMKMAKICQLCIEKNQKISKDFESRKQQISETIKELFKSAGLGTVLHHLNESVAPSMNKKYLFDEGRQTHSLLNPFLNSQTPLINGTAPYYSYYKILLDQYIMLFQQNCSKLWEQVNKEKVITSMYSFAGEQSLLNSWHIIENAVQQLLKSSDELFEGEGLRLGKKDGISDALTSVLDIIYQNTLELCQGLLSVVELTKGIAHHFEQADHWLGAQLKEGKFVGEMPTLRVPSNYTAYLEEDGVFDDVKDVLQAFDRQVEQRSRDYSRKVAHIFQEAIGKFEAGLQLWVDNGRSLKESVSRIKKTYELSVYIQEKEITIDSDGKHQSSLTTRYWGRVESLYPSYTREIIQQLDTTIISTFDRIQNCIWQCDKAKGQLQHLDSILKPIVEEGVYKAFDLDEIVQGQKTVLQLARRLSQEIDHVAHVITGEGLSSQSIDVLKHKLQDTKRLIDYYARFVGDCFGDNEYTTPGEVSSSSSRFSLNTPLPY